MLLSAGFAGVGDSEDHGSRVLQVGSEKMIYLGFLGAGKVLFYAPAAWDRKSLITGQDRGSVRRRGYRCFQMYLHVPYGDLGDRG
jgi:hypothetical protein